MQIKNVKECCVLGVTHKAGLISAGKVIQCRTPEEEELLEVKGSGGVGPDIGGGAIGSFV